MYTVGDALITAHQLLRRWKRMNRISSDLQSSIQVANHKNDCSCRAAVRNSILLSLVKAHSAQPVPAQETEHLSISIRHRHCGRYTVLYVSYEFQTHNLNHTSCVTTYCIHTPKQTTDFMGCSSNINY
jgi:hypothetical protein